MANSTPMLAEPTGAKDLKRSGDNPERTYDGGRSCTATDAYFRAEIQQIQPRTVVDFGAGVGKLGRLCRELLGDKVTLTAVEGFASTASSLKQSGIYDHVEQALLQDWIHGNTRKYDVATFGDVLEHVTRQEAFRAIDTALTFTPNVIVNIPLRNLLQDEVGGNVLEEHRAYFTEACFDRRFIFREKHAVMPDLGYVILNGWIIGRKRFRLRNSVRDFALKYFGRRARAVFESLGFDCYPRLDM